MLGFIQTQTIFQCFYDVLKMYFQIPTIGLVEDWMKKLFQSIYNCILDLKKISAN